MPSKHTKLEDRSTCLTYLCRQVSPSCVRGGLRALLMHRRVFVHVRARAPLGCPPLQGSEGSQQNFTGVLETALKLAHQDADSEDEDDGGQRAAAAKVETLQILAQMAGLL